MYWVKKKMYSEIIYPSKQKVCGSSKAHMKIPRMTILLFLTQENCQISNHFMVRRFLEIELYRPSSTTII